MRKLVLLFVAMLVPSLALAQVPVSPPRYGMVASHEHSPGGSLLIAYSREINGRWISESYLMQRAGPEAEAVVFVRRALDSYDGQEYIQWADSRACKDLITRLRNANLLEMPTLVLPLDDDTRERGRAVGIHPPPAADGGGPYVFWGPAVGTGKDFQISAYAGPWHAWADEMELTLGTCWRDYQPSLDVMR